MTCRHCGYRINPYTGNCQNKMCEPRPAPVVDADAIARSIAIQEENRRKSEETMRELWGEAIAGGCKAEDVPADYQPVSPVVAHLRDHVTNKKLFGVLAR